MNCAFDCVLNSFPDFNFILTTLINTFNKIFLTDTNLPNNVIFIKQQISMNKIDLIDFIDVNVSKSEPYKYQQIS